MHNIKKVLESIMKYYESIISITIQYFILQFYILSMGIPGSFSSVYTALVYVLGNVYLHATLLTFHSLNFTFLKIVVHP